MPARILNHHFLVCSPSHWVCAFKVAATSLLVLGALPTSLAANGGAGSAHVLNAAERWLLPPRLAATEAFSGSGSVRADRRLKAANARSSFLRTHLATDLLAGAWAFAAFCAACAAFAVAELAIALAASGASGSGSRGSDVLLGSSSGSEAGAVGAAALFLASQALLAGGAGLLALASYADGTNRASLWAALLPPSTAGEGLEASDGADARVQGELAARGFRGL